MPLSAVHPERFGVGRRKCHAIGGGTDSSAVLIRIVLLIVCRRIDGIPGRIFKKN